MIISFFIDRLQYTTRFTLRNSFEVVLIHSSIIYGGLTAFIALGKRLHLDFDAVFYQETADGIREAILDELYDEKNDIFYIANDASVKTEGTHWDVFYPDAYAQIFPVYFSVLDKKEGHRLFDSFKEHYPEENWLGSPIEQRVYCELVKAKGERENQSS